MSKSNKNNLTWDASLVSVSDRQKLKGHASFVLWFTGLSGSGKSTLANAVDCRLHHMKVHTYLLDGDNVRHGLNGDLGFSEADREENIRRVGHVAGLFVDAGVVAITALISPFRSSRQMVRSLFPHHSFIEVYVDCPIDVCMQRDPKGLYAKAQSGAIKEFTGISSPYEPPLQPEITVHTAVMSVEECTERILCEVQNRLWRESPIVRQKVGAQS